MNTGDQNTTTTVGACEELVSKQGGIYNGYSDSELELLAEPLELDTGAAPWVYWSSELHSVGRLYREWGFYPRMLPLFIYSDHGIHRVSEFTPHEFNSDAKVHFVFNQDRVQKNTSWPEKDIICVPHPWVAYRRKKNITQLKNAKGTLVFFSHACEGVEFTGRDSDNYFKALKELPEKFKPLVLCMHMHDIIKGEHKRIRKHGLPIITAGNTSSITFVDKFYDLIKNFKYACSNETGSQLYFCTEMGIPYFFIGDKVIGFNHSHPDLPLGYIDSDITEGEFRKIERDLFSDSVDSVNLHQKIFAEWVLGLNSNVTRLSASWIFWREFFRNWRKWHLMLRPSVKWILRKTGLLGLFEKLRSRST